MIQQQDLQGNFQLVDIQRQYQRAGADYNSNLQKAIAEANAAAPLRRQALIADTSSSDRDAAIQAVISLMAQWLKEYEDARTPKTWLGKIIKAIFG